ncbi:uncharacterized protein PADG_11678 [Paracoccidioides brasiliensis Pb18]|uniref:Uncharacterized protein n=1 Tax=Paracoccidioides brasiliensis (strain Pb18) TaxID=502780 RepID=A0A0A0HU43_PARBD|nr:uncharacterized protein PADG_11678 [Paracoccidioides brasiliensis Pb18]KGM92142.1 hypothetical protein PADG_11678 [Paracoccidioides brasiliensis Pb18]
MVQSETCAWAGPWLVLNLPSPTDPFRALTLGFVRGFTRGGEGKIARGQKQDPRVSASGGWWLASSSPPTPGRPVKYKSKLLSFGREARNCKPCLNMGCKIPQLLLFQGINRFLILHDGNPARVRLARYERLLR